MATIDIHVAALHQLLAHLGLVPARTGSLGGHDKPRPASFVQIAIEIADPDVVAVADLSLFVDSRETKGETWIPLHLVGIDLIHVEGGIGHDKVRLMQQFVGIFVVGDGFLDIPFEAVHRQVHLGQADGGSVLFQAVEGELLRGVFMPLLHPPSTLHKHSPGATCRIQHRTADGLNNVGDQRDQGDGGEKFAPVMGFLIRELGQEVFVDPAEDIPETCLSSSGLRVRKSWPSTALSSS